MNKYTTLVRDLISLLWYPNVAQQQVDQLAEQQIVPQKVKLRTQL